MPKLSGFAPIPLAGPRCAPIVGRPLALMRFFADPIGTLLELRRRYGKVAALIDGDPAMVVVSGEELNRQVLSNHALFTHAEDLVAAPPNTALERLHHNIIFSNGETHRRRRRLMMPALQKAALAGYAPVIVAAAKQVLDAQTLGPADLCDIFVRVSQAIAIRCLFGVPVEEGVREFVGRIEGMVAALSSPAYRIFPLALPGTPLRRALRNAGELESVVGELIERKRASISEPKDVLGMLIRAHDEDGGCLSRDDLAAEICGLFVAGHETTAVTLAWTVFLLERHPDVFGEVLDEVRAALGNEDPTAATIPKLEKLDRVVKESMRILPASATLFLRVCAEQAPLGSLRLPKDANVVVSPLLTHREEDIFPDSDRFDPSRWEQIRPALYAYLPFGAGARMCLGAGFAAQVIRLVLPMFLQRFGVGLVPHARVSRTIRASNVFGPKHGLPVLLTSPGIAPSRPAPIRGNIADLVRLPQPAT